ncbi:FAD binding domain protein [Hortaea werneckii]|uniref:FAD-binding PCMH-type domain-containing protein n=1 Tax=Hortaea werneckii TaxID=91943 RepID=A0A3M7FT27_HORWE|nr:FAD binding domain protein [Hortaea werneckii]RMY91995.1 hypothetical protein D0861_02764 [Hortaea werneckii]
MRPLIVPLCLASLSAARFTPHSNAETVHLEKLDTRQAHDVGILEQNTDGSMPYFNYEKLHLTSAEVERIQKKLSRTFGRKWSHYWNLFNFSSIDVTQDHQLPVDHTLTGPDNCKPFPGDAAWPSFWEWQALDLVTGGALIKPVPQAHVCYSNSTGSVDEAACETVSENWHGQYWQNNQDDPIEMLSPLYQGMSCQPPSEFNSTVGAFDNGRLCTQGGYPSYVVDVRTVAQMQLAVNFARNKGIRLVVKNTGHDFSGKSGGAGSLSLWTHHLKEVGLVEHYKSANYSGPAFKAGAGIQGFEIYKAISSYGLTTLGGECPTVSPTGGWIMGGGHAPASGIWGMGADHALAFEVVTADGRFVTASSDHNPDLFWALRGGGGLTFGVVSSVLFRVHKDVPVTSASWSFGTSAVATKEAVYAGLKSWFAFFPRGADNEIYAYFNIFNVAGSVTMTMAPFFAMNKTLIQAQEILQPWLDDMKSLGIPVEPEWQSFDGFYTAYNGSFPVEDVINSGVVTASRLFPRENFMNGTKLFDDTFDSITSNLDAGMAVIGYNMAPTLERGGYQNTSVSQAWRDSIGYMITGVVTNMSMPAEYLVEQRRNFTNGPMQRWRELTPGSGAYLNEADRMEPNFQYAFWGTKYPSLLKVKQQYDPFNLFYATTGVGSEFFEVRSIDNYPDENGRLCVNPNPKLYYPES